MKAGVFKRWRRGRRLRIRLIFDDIMDFALALLSISPVELETLGWSFADRKRLLDHFLASGRVAQSVSFEGLSTLPIDISLPREDLIRLQRFAARELPREARNAAVIDRVLTALDKALYDHDRQATKR